MPGRQPTGEKVYALAGTTETLDLSKVGRVFAGTVTAACVITLTNAPLGYTELHFYLTNPHTNFDIVACLWAAGTKTLTQTGIDYLKVGVYRTSSATVIFQAGKELALADN